jgi:hypothetical protein
MCARVHDTITQTSSPTPPLLLPTALERVQSRRLRLLEVRPQPRHLPTTATCHECSKREGSIDTRFRQGSINIRSNSEQYQSVCAQSQCVWHLYHPSHILVKEVVVTYPRCQLPTTSVSSVHTTWRVNTHTHARARAYVHSFRLRPYIDRRYSAYWYLFMARSSNSC